MARWPKLRQLRLIGASVHSHVAEVFLARHERLEELCLDVLMVETAEVGDVDIDGESNSSDILAHLLRLECSADLTENILSTTTNTPRSIHTIRGITADKYFFDLTILLTLPNLTRVDLTLPAGAKDLARLGELLPNLTWVTSIISAEENDGPFRIVSRLVSRDQSDDIHYLDRVIPFPS